MSIEESWKNICLLLYPRDAGLTAEVNLALTDPDSYFEEYEEDLESRGIRETEHVTAWLALVDGLSRRNSLAEVDWKCEAVELARDLEQLQICKDRRVTFSQIREIDRNTVDLIDIAGKELESHSLALIILDIGADCYPLVVVPEEIVPKVQKEAEKLRQKVYVAGSD